MATSTIGGLAAVAGLTAAALVEVEAAGVSKKATLQEVYDADPNPIKTSYNLTAGEGGAMSIHRFGKSQGSIADNTLTPVLTVTVPNTSHIATIEVNILAWLGAGGAIAEGEASAHSIIQVKVNRTAGLATVIRRTEIVAPLGDTVAGGATITLSSAVSGLTGANSVEQTFTIDVTINSGSGSSANHGVLLEVTLRNVKATGVSIA